MQEYGGDHKASWSDSSRIRFRNVLGLSAHIPNASAQEPRHIRASPYCNMPQYATRCRSHAMTVRLFSIEMCHIKYIKCCKMCLRAVNVSKRIHHQVRFQFSASLRKTWHAPFMHSQKHNKPFCAGADINVSISEAIVGARVATIAAWTQIELCFMTRHRMEFETYIFVVLRWHVCHRHATCTAAMPDFWFEL